MGKNIREPYYLGKPIKEILENLDILCKVEIPFSMKDCIGSEKCSNLNTVLKDLCKTLQTFLNNIGDGAEIVKDFNKETHQWDIKSITHGDSINIDESREEIKVTVNEDWLASKLVPIINLTKSLSEYIQNYEKYMEDNFCCFMKRCEPVWKLQEDLTGCSTSATEFIEWNDTMVEDGKYIETYKDINPYSCTRNNIRIERRPELDCEGAGEPPRWEDNGAFCCKDRKAYKALTDVEVGSKTYGEKDCQNYTVPFPEKDGYCVPKPRPTGSVNKCCSIRVELGVYGSKESGGNSINGELPEGATFDTNTGCVSLPETVEKDISGSITVQSTIKVRDPKNEGWQVKTCNGEILKNGTGDKELTVSTDIIFNYYQKEFEEGTFWAIN